MRGQEKEFENKRKDWEKKDVGKEIKTDLGRGEKGTY